MKIGLRSEHQIHILFDPMKYGVISFSKFSWSRLDRFYVEFPEITVRYLTTMFTSGTRMLFEAVACAILWTC